MEPSPTAEATRFTFPDRASPTTKTPGTLVSNMCGGRDKGHGIEDVADSTSRPVSTNPFLSSDTHPESQSVLGDAPAITNTWRIGCVDTRLVSFSIQDTCSRCVSPSSAVSSLE